MGQYAFFVGNQEAKFWVRFVAENAQNEQAISIAFPISPSTSAASFPCCLEEDLLQPVLIGAKKPGFKFAAKAAPKIGVAQSAAARRGSAAIKGSPYWIRLKNRTSCTVTGYLTGPDAGSIPENAGRKRQTWSMAHWLLTRVAQQDATHATAGMGFSLEIKMTGSR